MKRFILALLIIAVPLIMPLAASASDTSLANYKAIVTISNNSTATTNVAVPFTLNTTALVAAGYIDSACTRVAMTDSTDAKFMPGYGANPWVVFVPSIGADATVRDTLYTANTSLSSTKYYFPGSTGMTVADNATLELGGNFTLTFNDTFINTGGYIFNKPQAISAKMMSTTNISAWIYSYVSPTGGSGTGWSTISNAYDGNAVTYASKYMTISNWTGQIILTRAATNTDSIGYYILDTSPATVIDIAAYYDSAWHTVYNGAPTKAAWAYVSLDGFHSVTQIAFNFYHGGDGTTYLCEATLDSPLIIDAVTTSGEKDTITLSADSTNFTMAINGTTVDTIALGVLSVPNNANGWTFGDDDATPYFSSINMTIGGNPRAFWQWEYAATFTDTVSGIVGTPSFRTTSSDADVSATISSFTALDTATAPSYTVTEQSAFYTGNITATGNFTSTGRPGTGPAVLDVVDDVATAGDVPSPFLWGIIGCFAFASSGLALSYAHKKFAIGGGYVFIMLIVGVIIFGLLIAFKVFDWWMLWFYLIIAGGIAMASRHIDWGGSTSQHSLIGFLAMAWVGLTLINRILEGAFITSAETAYLNTVTFTKAFSLLNLFTIPIMNWEFFTVGIPSLLRWDYSFFGGQAQILQYLMYSVTAVVSFIIFGIILGLVYSAITRSS